MMKIEITEISPCYDNVRELFRLLDTHNMSHHPPEVCHLTQPEELQEVRSILLGIFCDGELCGMGALKFFDDYAEVTRMFVKEAYRGNGLAGKLLDELAKVALTNGLTVLRLETSEKFRSAVRLYQNYGFHFCEPFGEYVNKPLNTYMEKQIEGS